MGDYIRWSPPYYEGAEDSAKSALFLALNRGKRSIRLEPQGGARPRGAAAAGARVRRAARVVPAGRDGPARRRLRAPARGEPAGSCTARSPATARTARTRDRSGHDMNYLGLIGLLGLTGERDGPPVQAGRPDRRPRRRRADGRVRDPRRAARARALAARASSWTCRCPTARSRGSRWWPRATSPTGAVPQRGELELAGGAHLLPALRVQRTAGSRSARSSRSSGRRGAAGWGARTWSRSSSRRPARTRTPRSSGSSSSARATSGSEFASEHDCCLEPVLDLDEALDSELVRAREMVVELDQPGTDGVRQLGVPVKLSRTPGAPRGPGPGARRAHREVLAALGYATRRSRRSRSRAPWRAGRGRAGELPGMSTQPGATANGLLKMSELAEASGVSAPARSSTTCARGCCPSRSRPRATWPTTRPSSSSGSG